MLHESIRRTLLLAFTAMMFPWFMTQRVESKDCNETAEQVFAKASHSVARIFVIAIDPFNPQDKVSYSIGTGFLIDGDGTLVTNYHVILNAKFIKVNLGNEQSDDADFIAGDPILDIAIIKLRNSPGSLETLPFAADQPPAIGSPVYAIGHPLGLKMSISSGIISSVDVVLPVTTMSWDEPYIQTDAAINPGNSGGPLIDQCGRVVGMNSLGFGSAENIGFAIPTHILKMAIGQLLKEAKIARPWIGISGRIADPFIMSLAQMPFVAGFLVETVEPGSAADLAGLRGGSLPMRLGPSDFILGGDIITSVNGIEVTDLAASARIVRSLKVGDKIKVEYVRGGEYFTLETVLPERPILAEDIRVLSRNTYRPE